MITLAASTTITADAVPLVAPSGLRLSGGRPLRGKLSRPKTVEPRAGREAESCYLMEADRSLERVIAELQAGVSREDNFQVLFRRFWPAVNRFFARLGVSVEECRDLAQETFLGVYSGIGSYRGEARFESWLFTIATNVYRKRARRRSAGKRAGQELSLEEAVSAPNGPTADRLADPSPTRLSPEESLLRNERTRRVLGAVDALPERMRECLILRVLQDLTYEEIAVAMRLSSQTVRSHLFQARRRLKEHLSEVHHAE